LRAAAGAAGLVLVVAAAWSTLWVGLSVGIGVQAPDPFIPNGDPCCGHPNSWGEVAEAAVGGVVASAVVGALAGLGASLIWWGARGRWLRRGRLLLLPAVVAALTSVVVVVALVPILGEGRTPPDCDTFVPRESDWLSSSRDTRLRTAHGISRCGSMDGWRPERVARLLGDPLDERGTPKDGSWTYDGVSVYFAAGRVEKALLPDDY